MLDWLSANIGNIVIIAVLLAIVALIIIKLVKDKKAGKTCSSCSSKGVCPHCGSCPSCKPKNKTENWTNYHHPIIYERAWLELSQALLQFLRQKKLPLSIRAKFKKISCRVKRLFLPRKSLLFYISFLKWFPFGNANISI